MRLFSILTIASLLAAQAPNPPRVIFSTTTNVVVVDVRVSDANGKPVNSLTKDDFVIFEDNKQQTLLSCDLQKLETTALPAAAPELKTRDTAAPPAPPKPAPAPVNTDPDTKYRDRRLIVMLFDLAGISG